MVFVEEQQECSGSPFLKLLSDIGQAHYSIPLYCNSMSSKCNGSHMNIC